MHGTSPYIAELGKATQFKPGNPGGGRPVGTGQNALKKKLEKYLSLETPVILPDGTKTSREVIDRIVLSMLNKASGGDMAAIKEVFDRFYGKLSDKVELTGADGGAIHDKTPAPSRPVSAGSSISSLSFTKDGSAGGADALYAKNADVSIDDGDLEEMTIS